MKTGNAVAKFWLFVLILTGAAGCYPIPKEFSKNDLVGVYVLRYSFGVEELRINPDGSYVQTYFGKRKMENSGKWQLHQTQIMLDNALIFSDPFGKQLETPERGNVGLDTAWYFGRLVLDANPDQGFMYEKQN